VVELF